LEKVLMRVGETALSVSRRRLAPFPKLRGCAVLTESFGRWGGADPRGIIGSAVVMFMLMAKSVFSAGAGAGDGWKAGGIECESVASIMVMCGRPRTSSVCGRGRVLLACDVGCW
jgi:hypothetical protein